MATTFTNTATLSYTGGSVQSNIAVGSVEGILSVSKTTAAQDYQTGESITYAVSIINHSDTAVTGLNVTDDLGSYIFNTGTVQPLSYIEDSALYFSDGTDPRIRFDGKGKSVTAQRSFYYSSKEPNILTSAPMLINDFEPVGETFVSYTGNLNSLNYEDPRRHQGVRHPRTAIATTENNHLLMVVIDGRRSGVSEGMTAREVTGFLVQNFNPQYALNLDGGGSSTLCVAGLGDKTTHVVNKPTDSEGERSVTTHLFIIPKK